MTTVAPPTPLDVDAWTAALRSSVILLVEPLRRYGPAVVDEALAWQGGLARPDSFGWTVLMGLLAMPDPEHPANDEPLVEALLERGVPAAAVARDGTCALLLAAARGNDPVVARLLAAGAPAHNVRQQAMHPRRTTALHEAAGVSPEVVQRLLAAGADPTVRNLDGHTALHLAVWANRPDVVEVLVHAAAPFNPSVEGNGLLHDALTQAPAIVERLLEHGADAHALDPVRQGTVLHTLARAPIHTTIKVRLLRRMLAEGLDPNQKDGAGQTPLHELITHGLRLDWRSMFTLVRGGADLTLVGGTATSPQQPAGDWLYERCVTNPFHRNDVDTHRLHRLMELFEVVRAAHETPAEPTVPMARSRRRL